MSEGELIMPSENRANRRAFTLVELLVVIGVISILAVMLFPVMTQMQSRSKNAACQQNLRKIGQGILQYAWENDGHFPPHWGDMGNSPSLVWYGFVAPYVCGWNGNLAEPMNKDFFCPSVPQSRHGQTYTSTTENGLGMTYGYNYYKVTQNAASQGTFKTFGISKLSKLVLVADIPSAMSGEAGVPLPGFMAQYLLYPGSAAISERHPGKTCNVVFADGHVENRDARSLATQDEGFDAGNWDPNY